MRDARIVEALSMNRNPEIKITSKIKIKKRASIDSPNRNLNLGSLRFMVPMRDARIVEALSMNPSPEIKITSKIKIKKRASIAGRNRNLNLCPGVGTP
jgi:hypothetical protein